MNRVYFRFHKIIVKCLCQKKKVYENNVLFMPYNLQSSNPYAAVSDLITSFAIHK